MKELNKRIKDVLEGKKKTIWFDIDGTLATTKGNDYENAKPVVPMVVLVNQLYDAGHTITLFTGRGATSGKDWVEFTENQLKEWDVKYHNLIMGFAKDIVIDDCSTTPEKILEALRGKL